MVEFSENALQILRERYFLKNDKGELIENRPEEMFSRVANAIASAEQLFSGNVQKSSDIYYEAMINKRLVPSSPILFNAGNVLGMLSSCFVFILKDDIRDIFKKLGDTAFVFSRGGGMGLSFSKLRQKGALIRSSKGSSSGPVSFMEIFNTMGETVKGGGFRKTAMLSSLDINHPDVEDFILAKTKEGKLNNFNISVEVSDSFMEDVKNKDKKALKKWKIICQSAWNNGEPGLLFIDEIKRKYPIPSLKHDIGANACAEIIAPNSGSCNLSALNLVEYSKTGKFNWRLFKQDIQTAIRFLDDMLEINKYPLPEMEFTAKQLRQVGLGLCSFAYTLMDLGITYGSSESYRFAEELAEFLVYHSQSASSELAKKRGKFPLYSGSIYETRDITRRGLQSKFDRPDLDYIELKNSIENYGIRNSSSTTLMPTGTTARICDGYFSIEPIFAVKVESKIIDKKQINIIPEKYINHPNLITTHDLKPEQHVKMIASFIKYIENNISKTVNLPFEATVEDVENIFLMAYDMKLKSITVYRNNSRKEQVLNKIEEPKECKSGKCNL